MSSWFADALKRAEQIDDWLTPARQVALAQLRDTAWPTRKTEAWKYTSLYPLAEAHFHHGAANDGDNVLIEGLDSLDLLFVNGQLQALPEGLPQGLTITTLADADSATQDWALKTFSQVKPKRHLFGLLNDVLVTQGLLISVADNAAIEQPLRIVNIVSQGVEAHSRVVVRVGTGASLTVIEQNLGQANSFVTAFAEYDVAEQATLEHYRFEQQVADAMSIGGSHFRLAGKAELNSTLIGFGSKVTRVDVDVEHAGEHANAKLNAIYLLDGNELFDLHSTIEHAVPHGTTEENVRGIVGGESTAVFNGRIHIHRDAQKTLAELNNRNLLLSRKAEINTKPELEIYADDVRCAHGATVAEVDKKSLYYLQSRGIDLQQAQVMLNFGFVNELVDQMPNAVLAEWLRPLLRQRFADMNRSAS